MVFVQNIPQGNTKITKENHTKILVFCYNSSIKQKRGMLYEYYQSKGL